MARLGWTAGPERGRSGMWPKEAPQRSALPADKLVLVVCGLSGRTV